MLCQRARALLENSDQQVVVCDLGALTSPDLSAVDVVARLQVTARRCGHEVRVRHACPGFRDLLGLTGLAGVVLLWEGSGVEALGQSEQGEHPGGIEEERDAGDLPV